VVFHASGTVGTMSPLASMGGRARRTPIKGKRSFGDSSGTPTGTPVVDDSGAQETGTKGTADAGVPHAANVE
jgi:hypothetical protein